MIYSAMYIYVCVFVYTHIHTDQTEIKLKTNVWESQHYQANEFPRQMSASNIILSQVEVGTESSWSKGLYNLGK